MNCDQRSALALKPCLPSRYRAEAAGPRQSNVLLISPSTPATQKPSSQNQPHRPQYATQQHNEFGSERNAILFTPGDYHLDIPIGFSHLRRHRPRSRTPDAKSTSLATSHVDAASRNNNATTITFWRSAEGFSGSPQPAATKDGTMRWPGRLAGPSPFRRMHIRGDNAVLHQHGGWASGGWMSGHPRQDGTVASGPQQQWILTQQRVGTAGPAPTGTWSSSASPTHSAAAIVPKPCSCLHQGRADPHHPRKAVPRSRYGRPLERPRTCATDQHHRDHLVFKGSTPGDIGIPLSQPSFPTSAHPTSTPPPPSTPNSRAANTCC